MIVLYIVTVVVIGYLLSLGVRHIIKMREQKFQYLVQKEARENLDQTVKILVADRELANDFQNKLNEAMKNKALEPIDY